MPSPPGPRDSNSSMAAAVWTVHCDGTALPNPGRMAIGAVIVAPDGARHSLSQAMGLHGCNNEAEVRALMVALQALRNFGTPVQQALRIFTDSRVLVDQLCGTVDRPIARLAAVFQEVRALLECFSHVELQWVPRHRNTEADALARAALGLPSKAGLRPRPKKRRAR